MGYIGDISKFQPKERINWPVFAKNFDLLIIRVQYGSTIRDEMYSSHVANAKKYGVPFNTYAFPAFISVEDARVEARDCWNRTDKDSEVIWIDIESEYSNGKPVGITKLSQSVRLEGIKAYADELRKQGAKKVGAYVAHNVYEAWGINTIIGIFDTVWIPRYGSNNGKQNTKPDYPCCLWQYTSVGRLPGYDGPLDLNVLNGDKSIDWFTGKGTPQANVQPVASPGNGPVAQVQVLVDDLNIRSGAGTNYSVVRKAEKGEVFDVYANVNDWHNVGGNNWVFGNNGQYLSLLRGERVPVGVYPLNKASRKRYVVLPATASEWRIYPTNKAPVKANALPTKLKPAKFGGLEYEILGNPQADVYTIRTGDFGVVNIYAAPSTGAKIITK